MELIQVLMMRERYLEYLFLKTNKFFDGEFKVVISNCEVITGLQPRFFQNFFWRKWIMNSSLLIDTKVLKEKDYSSFCYFFNKYHNST